MKRMRFFQKIREAEIFIIDEYGVEQTLSIEQAQAKFGIKWIEHQSLLKNNLYQKLQIRFMGPILKWGLFAKENIAQDEIIGIFTGKVYCQNQDTSVTAEHIFLRDTENNQFQVVDATKCGNMTRFIQHLPTENIVNQIKFTDPTIRERVATSNVYHELFQLGENFMTEIYRAKTFIKAGEIIGANYHESAWISRAPLLLQKNGEIISDECYNYPRSDCTKVYFDH